MKPRSLWMLSLGLLLLLLGCIQGPMIRTAGLPTTGRGDSTSPLPGTIPPSATASPTLTLVPTASATPTATLTLLPAAKPSPTPTYAPLHFAVIGDFGRAGFAEQAVARLVKSWNPDVIITVGDNNYPSGSRLTIEKNLAVYKEYIESRRFYPVLGNHDWGYHSVRTLPFVQYFDYLPGNRRYYDIVLGPVHFFMLDSDWHEPDGVRADGKQAQWLRERMLASTLPWQIVVLHHAPYSSGWHGDTKYMQWPFAQWGADVVLAGHDHTYERIHRDGIVYIVNGLGGAPNRYPFQRITQGSQVRYNRNWGALWAEATASQLHFRFITIDNQIIDDFVVVHR